MNTIIPLPGTRVAAELGRNEIKIRSYGPPPGEGDTVQIDSMREDHVPAPIEKKDRRKPIEVKSGSSVVKIYPSGGTDKRPLGPFTIAWREHAGGKRMRAMRTSLAKAKELAEEKAQLLANGQTQLLGMTPGEHASYVRSVENLLPIGESLEVATSKYAQAILKLDGGTLEDAVRCYLDHRPGGITSKLCSEIVAEMLAYKKTKRRFGARWAVTLKNQLDSFAEKFKCPLHMVRAPQINAWLGALGVAEHTQANYRAAVVSLITFAKTRGYVAADWSEMNRVDNPETTESEIKILTPEQITKLLAISQPSIVPFIALTAFAGIRNEEMSGKKQLLDWSDVRIADRLIYVPKKVAKTGADRTVPICDNLAAWLLPFQKRNGPVCAISSASDALCDAKKRAGIPSGKNETRNTLRKSFISYRLAIVKNIAQVAEEAGNSAAKIKSNYKRAISEKEANRWFDIWPTTAGIVQLQLGGMA